MKTILLITSLLAALVIQGCSNGLATSKPDDATNKPLATSSESKSIIHVPPVHITPEIQIIREMFQAGCLIKQLELNRRQQNIRISCAHEQLRNGFSSGTL